MKIYISGPMSGKEDFNRPAFNRAAERLRGLGFTVVNPAEFDEPSNPSWEEYMKIAIRELTGCDLVVQLPEWKISDGAQIEERVATWLGIECRSYSEFEHE